METLNNIATIIGIIGGISGIIAAVFRYVIITPLETAIANLGQELDRLGKIIDGLDERQRDITGRLAKVEDSTKNAYHRIDELREDVKILQGAK